MEESHQVYSEAISLVEITFPDIAEQIREEVARGRPIAVRKLDSSEVAEREVRMKGAHAGRLGQQDVAVIDYSDDDQLRILLEAIVNLSATMVASRRSLVELDATRRLDTIEIGAPEAGDADTVDLQAEVQAADFANLRITELLRPILDDLSPE